MPNDEAFFGAGRPFSARRSSPWGGAVQRPFFRPIDRDLVADVVVIGAGLSGALLAEHLTAQGRSVCVIDAPQRGLSGTASSTALLRWEHEKPLLELESILGFDKAASLYRRSISALTGLTELIAGHDIPCAFVPRRSLYLADHREDAAEILVEYDLRQRAGLPSLHLSRPDLLEQFGLDRPAAILSPGAAEVDPLILERSLLSLAQVGGARLVEAAASGITSSGGRVTIETTASHAIEASQVVLATGHTAPGIALPSVHFIRSSWAIATAPQAPEAIWAERALLWDAFDFDPLFYARTTSDGRIIIGGMEEEIDGGAEALQDLKTPMKTAALRERLARLTPAANLAMEQAWCGSYGATEDGLPLIGPVPDLPGVFAAFGFGCNGIALSFMASRIINAQLAGSHRDWFADFALDRDIPRGL
ncbi:FAD-binding oxidoreductase [Rhizobiaceae bacterium n13]|uniref:FAD-binding oxidoreductase n=1 Tax=Ferirhizobium litorale TaxID=2927786 RepID=A0AAE3Q920_9HYPH|nr:FAD-dependent oxidoreductase [Fererhizobium litorale]MDI7861305.1 FAD-binding oxidoreductase [Fererhizobium litorale]MDI7921452.1 FAD-binding oxidoreductase [Fererhizobium litorale]